MSPACVLVLGTPRSGTSLAAGILHSLGVPMGERTEDGWDFIGPDEWNPKGLFEDAAFGNLCLSALGWPWPDQDVALTTVQRKKLADLLARRAATSPCWGIKSAGLAYLLPEVLSLCPTPIRIVQCQRQRPRSVESWATRAGCSSQEAATVIDAVALRLGRVIPEHLLRLKLHFDNLADWPRLLAEYVGMPLTPEASSFPDSSLVRF